MKVFLKGYETRALRTPEALAKFVHECGKNVRAARLAREGDPTIVVCSVDANSRVFLSRPQSCQRTPFCLHTYDACFSFLVRKIFSQWILSEFNGGEFWKKVTTFRISCDTCRPFSRFCIEAPCCEQ